MLAFTTRSQSVEAGNPSEAVLPGDPGLPTVQPFPPEIPDESSQGSIQGLGRGFERFFRDAL